MSRYFQEVRQYIESQDQYLPLHGRITGGNYPPHPLSLAVANIASLAFMAGMFLVFLGDTLFKILQVPEPQWFRWMAENKVIVIMSLFLGNSVANSLLSTGAFEIYFVNSEGSTTTLFSKLESRRLPNADDIARAFSAIKFN